MKNNYQPFLRTCLLIFLGGFLTNFSQAQDNTIEIKKEGNIPGFTPPIPVSIEGFTGETLQVLKFDLYVQGFSFVEPGQAQYQISGSADGNITGRVSASGRNILSRAYSGAGERREVHAFADDIVRAITGRDNPPIGQTKIAFKVQEPSGSGEIYVSDFDGHNAQAITTDAAIVAAPAWVPGRLALYYTSYKLGSPDIFYQDLSSGQRTVFARYPGLNTSAAVSPDGSKVAMILSRSGDPNVWVCNANGSGLKQLTFTHADDSCPCWSPDGQWICFATKIHARRLLAKVPAAGGEIETFHTTGAPNPTEPDWSPDGKWIAFTEQAGEFDICVMPADGSAGPITLVPGQHPSWAPNSRTLVYNHAIGYRPELSVLDVFTKQHKNTAQVAGDDSEPAWAK
jgi:TolB protein